MPGAGVPLRISQQAAGRPEFSAYWLRIRKRTALPSGFVCGIWASLAACRETTQTVIPRAGFAQAIRFFLDVLQKTDPSLRPELPARPFFSTPLPRLDNLLRLATWQGLLSSRKYP